jgi:hypothetical protein
MKVMCRRSIAALTVGAVAGAAASCVPQLPQNLALGGCSVPHDGQRGASGAPHCAQNFAPGGGTVPHA